MKSFPAHYHLVEFIYSTLNFNSREQALVTKQENHRFISIESIIDYFTRCKECKFEITEKEKERKKERKFWILSTRFAKDERMISGFNQHVARCC